jgi:hypothetical protein
MLNFYLHLSNKVKTSMLNSHTRYQNNLIRNIAKIELEILILNLINFKPNTENSLQ